MRDFVIAAWRAKGGQSRCVKEWEIIADNLSKAGWSWGLCVSIGFSEANNLDCGRTPRRRKALRCTSGWKVDGVCGIGKGDFGDVPMLAVSDPACQTASDISCLTSRWDFFKTRLCKERSESGVWV